MPPPIDPWLPYRKPRPAARVRLFCFPYAGGGASIYRAFTDALPPTIDVCAVQLPGREGRLREAPVPAIGELVPRMADGLAPHLTPPFALLGHSMGSVIAFELCRELRRRGAPMPAHLFASACPAPHIPDTDATHHLDDAALVERLRALGGMSEEVLAHRELMEMILPVFRADAAITELYVHTDEPPLDVPITAVGGLADDKATRADMDAWRQHTRAAFALSMVPGGHFYAQEPAGRSLLAAIVAKAIG